MKHEHSKHWPKSDQAGIVWLGQAGFWINTGQHRILIDPYLSDSLATKYAGQKNDHKRMVPIPILPKDLPKPDIILVTHAHTDHMDAQSLTPIAALYPDVPILVPRSKIKVAKERIGANAHLIGVDADEIYRLDNTLKIKVFPAAHEEREHDEQGHHIFIGYGINDRGLKIYHSGDTIPFDDLSERVQEFAPQIALLPVNGRDELRLNAGIPGNLMLKEAFDLGKGAEIFIPHHWGMFAFNTIDPNEILEFANANSQNNMVIPRHGETILFSDFSA